MYQKKGLTGRKVIVTRQRSLHPVGCILKRSDAWTLAQCCRWQGEIKMPGLIFCLFFLFLLRHCVTSCCRNRKKTQQVDGRLCHVRQSIGKIKAIKGTQIEVWDGSREIKALEQNETLCFLAAQNLSAHGQSFLHLSANCYYDLKLQVRTTCLSLFYLLPLARPVQGFLLVHVDFLSPEHWQ